ncbi:MAG: hypothetical protein L3J44_00550 [Campylobacteraceae bacterium]|nr:hypothetical protein [Campylobacteraceae bacterium]
MDQFFPAIFISIVVAFILIKNIKKITEKMDIDASNPHTSYASFSAHIQEYIRDMKKDLNKKENNNEVVFVLKEDKDLEKSQEKLSDFIRKLVFFETTMAQNKTKEQIENDLAQTLFDLDSFVRENIQNGELIADKMREDLQSRFEELRS